MQIWRCFTQRIAEIATVEFDATLATAIAADLDA